MTFPRPVSATASLPIGLRGPDALLDRVVGKLRNEFVQHGRPEHFERLKAVLLGQSDAPYAALAREMNTSEGALKVAIHSPPCQH